MEMNESFTPSVADLWHEVNLARVEIAELKGMLTMHLREGEHHYPPCEAAKHVQNTMLTAVGSALLALLAAVGGIAWEIMGR